MSRSPSSYWVRVRRITALLLLVWFFVSFVVTFFARELDFAFFGWPFSYWVAAQGALVVYGLLIAAYAWHVNRLDDEYGVADPPAPDDGH